MAAIQRPSGDMDPLQRSYSRRSLLPIEQQIIDTLGLTLDEYWEFCRLADCKAKERGEEYALIPEVVATGEPSTTLAIISIAISVLSTAAALLLAPKPPSLEDELSPIRTADIRGQTKFAELYAFDSLQDLATLGSIIPLVFVKQIPDPGLPDKVVGGIRVKSLLLWSQLLSKGSHQELKMLTTLGLSELAATPDSQGLAIGDQLLRNYQDARYRVYFRNNIAKAETNFDSGGRVLTNNTFAGSLEQQIDPDVFTAFDPSVPEKASPFTSGTRTPNSQRQFGCHTPISNGAPYFLPYNLVQVFDDDDSLKAKRSKINGPKGTGHSRPYCSRQGMGLLVRIDPETQLETSRFEATPGNAASLDIKVGDRLAFGNSPIREDPDAFDPHGLDDVNTAIVQRIVASDQQINIGDLFSFGSAIIQCTRTSDPNPFEEGITRDKFYDFVCIEAGVGHFIAPDNVPELEGNVAYGMHLQKIDIATITNNRSCDQTEIGIKSVVFKQVNNFVNVNSEPPERTLEDYEEDNQSFQLGRITTFQTRYSFFKIQYRAVGAADTVDFSDITGDRIFAVKGNTPQPQYNTISISHPRGQYEFKLVPLSGAIGNDRLVSPIANKNKVYLLDGTNRQEIDDVFKITYTGREQFITDGTTTNEEFLFKRALQDRTITGRVLNLDRFSQGELPAGAGWKDVNDSRVDYDPVNRQLKYGVFVNVDNPTAPGAVVARWDGVDVAIGAQYRYSDASSDIVATLPALNDFRTLEPEILVRTGSTPHFYVELDGAGNLVAAVYSGNGVTAQTQDPNLPNDLTKIYRVGANILQQTVQIPASVADDPAGPQYDPYTENGYFGVWERRADGIRTGVWNGQVVQLTTKADSELEAADFTDGFAYVTGNKRDFFPTINCDVYEIKRKVYTPPGTQRYFRSIEKVESFQIHQALNLYAIERYEWDHEAFPFVQTPYDGNPKDYSPDSSINGSGSGLKINASSLGPGHWQWQIVDPGSGYKRDDVIRFNFTDGSFVDVFPTELGSEVIPGGSRELLNPRDAIADFPKYQEEKTSHQDGPEHEVVFVNEMIRPDKDKVVLVNGVEHIGGEARYNDLSLLGIRLLAGKDWTSLGQLSAYVKQGIVVDRLINDSGGDVVDGALTGPTNNFAEIAYNLLTSPRLGAGKRIPKSTVDRDAMQIAAKFCHANNFTFDGVIGEKAGVRDFIFTNAALNLLDFAIVGGKFSLIPSVPYDALTFEIKEQEPIDKKIKALFTDGNMKDMTVSFLPAQERQLPKVTVAYRQEKENGFSSQEVVQIRLSDEYGGSDSDPEEFLDLTQFCTFARHAETIAKYKLLLRKHSDHNIDFKTTPSSALGVAAGDYITVISHSTHTNRFNNGSVDAFGGITSSTPLNDSTGTKVYYWKPGNTDVKEGDLVVTDNKTGDPAFFGTVFTIKMTNDQRRVYRVNSITIDDEGLVDISAAHQELYDLRNSITGEVIGSALATINISDASKFKVTR